MKKFLLFAAIAATMATASAEDFGTYFALTYEGEALTNGQTLTVGGYYDPVLQSYPELSGSGYESSSFYAQATVVATNVYDESMDISFSLQRIQPSLDEYPSTDSVLGNFQLCFEFSTAPGNCLSPVDDVVSSVQSVDNDGDYISMDVDQTSFTDFTPVTFQLDLCVMEGGEKIEGTDCTIYVNFTHTTDISLGVKGVEVEEDATEVYYNLQGMQVATPEKGNIYIVRKGGKVSKRVF